MSLPKENKRRKVVVTNWVHPEVTDTLTAAGCDVIANRSREQPFTRADIVEKGADADALLAFMTDSVDADLLAEMPNLEIVAGALKGYDNYDAEACTHAGVWLTIVPDLLTVPTAELTVGLMIGLARKVMEGDRYMRSRKFEGWRPQFYGTGIAGSTIGIVGMGAVGRAVANRLAGFEASLLYFDPRDLSGNEASESWKPVSLEKLFRESDFVVLTAPLSEATADLINAGSLALMKRGAFLVNPARGSLVDEEAVADALESGQLAGYAADVFEMEDWAREGRRRSIPERLLRDEARTLLTPHIGSAVDAIRRDITMAAANSILQVFEGREPDGAVNDPRGRRAVSAVGA